MQSYKSAEIQALVVEAQTAPVWRKILAMRDLHAQYPSQRSSKLIRKVCRVLIRDLDAPDEVRDAARLLMTEITGRKCLFGVRIRSRNCSVSKYLSAVAHRLENQITPTELRVIWDIYGHRCFYCQVPLTIEKISWNTVQWEHKIPKSRGGSNGVDNIVPACVECNTQKGTMTDVEFRAACAGIFVPLSGMMRVSECVLGG